MQTIGPAKVTVSENMDDEQTQAQEVDENDVLETKHDKIIKVIYCVVNKSYDLHMYIYV